MLGTSNSSFKTYFLSLKFATAFCSCVVQKDVEDGISESLGHFSVSDKLGGRRSARRVLLELTTRRPRDGVITQAGRWHRTNVQFMEINDRAPASIQPAAGRQSGVLCGRSFHYSRRPVCVAGVGRLMGGHRQFSSLSVCACSMYLLMQHFGSCDKLLYFWQSIDAIRSLA